MFTYSFTVFSQKVEGGFRVSRNGNLTGFPVSRNSKPEASCAFLLPGNPKPGQVPVLRNPEPTPGMCRKKKTWDGAIGENQDHMTFSEN
jgi:hypothetical protein